MWHISRLLCLSDILISYFKVSQVAAHCVKEQNMQAIIQHDFHWKYLGSILESCSNRIRVVMMRAIRGADCTCKLNILFFIFFFNFCWTMIPTLTLVHNISHQGASQMSPHFQCMIAIWRHFICFLMPCHECLQRVIVVWSPIAKTFDKSSDRGSIMPPQLNPNRKLAICGMTMSDCTTTPTVVTVLSTYRSFSLFCLQTLW